MSDEKWVETLALEIRRIGLSGAPDLETAIEKYLAGELRGREVEERLRILELLAQKFGMSSKVVSSTEGVETIAPTASIEVTRLVSLVLGKPLRENDINSKEIYEKFSGALTTLFDTLNEIISVINITLMGQSPELETIRKVIGSNIEGGEKVSLKEYLDRIQKASKLMAHQR